MSDELFIGIDLGTSGIKLVVADMSDCVVASVSRKISTQRLHEGWNEQNADDWWTAVVDCFDELAQRKEIMQRVRGISLSGQMLGPVLIDKHDKPIRPVILWNDSRSVVECRELLELVPDIGMRTNCTPDPGVGAPKLRWLAKFEPHVIEQSDCLLAPKDFIRLKLTGERLTEPSDAGGMMLMECATSEWSQQLCEAANWDIDHLPPVIWSWESAGKVLPELARRFNLPTKVHVAAGAGDNMACSLGVGAATPGDCVLTIGTSGVICTVSSDFKPMPDIAMLTSHHAAPDCFLSMGVVMSATSSFDWLASLTGNTTETLSAKVDQLYDKGDAFSSPVCAPWLAGNRTPHNKPSSRGIVEKISLNTTAEMLGWSVLEGVAFQFRECFLAQEQAGITTSSLSLVGGGANNLLWSKLVATLLEQPAVLPVGRHVAACVGAARLAQVGAGFGSPEDILGRKPQAEIVVDPDVSLSDELLARFERYNALSDGI